MQEMENASDALKMAAAVMIFVGALTLAIVTFTKARVTSEHIMNYSDKSVYYDINENTNYYLQKEVGIESVIASIYNYYSSQNTLLFYTGTYNESTGKVSITGKIPLYESEALSKNENHNLSNAYLERSVLRINNSRQIFGFDINDELTRNEPWSGSMWTDKLFVDAFINNGMLNDDGTVKTPDYYTTEWSRNKLATSNKYDLATHTLSMKFLYTQKMNGFKFANNPKARFIERVGVYNYDALYDDAYDENGQLKSGATVDFESGVATTERKYTETDKADAVIRFNNGSSITNEKATQKKVIQFIYIGQG